MTEDRNGGTEDVENRVRELLAEIEKRLASYDREEERDPREEFGDIAERANELVTENDPADLLDAVAGDEASAEDPKTIAEAIAESDPETVVSLRKLLTLSKMHGEDDDESLAESVEKLRDLSDFSGGGRDEATMDGDTDGSGDGGSDPPDDGSADGSAMGEEEGYAERLRETLQGGIDEFRDGIQEARTELQGKDENESEGEDDEPIRSTARDGTMFSTVPSSDRADMGRPKRFSTVRNRRKDND